MTIPLCDLPEGCPLQVTSERTARSFCAILLLVAIPSRANRFARWCALTAPFHPCLWRWPCGRAHRRFVFCCTLRQVAPTWLAPALCPMKPRLSSEQWF